MQTHGKSRSFLSYLLHPQFWYFFIKSNCPASSPFTAGSVLILQSAGFFTTMSSGADLSAVQEPPAIITVHNNLCWPSALSEEQCKLYTKCIFHEITRISEIIFAITPPFFITHVPPQPFCWRNLRLNGPQWSKLSPFGYCQNLFSSTYSRQGETTSINNFLKRPWMNVLKITKSVINFSSQASVHIFVNIFPL